MKSFSMEINPGDIVTFIYKNYAGKVSRRTAKVLRFYWASNEYHPEPQFLMAGIDLDKAEPRGFAVKDISELELIAHEKLGESRLSRIYHPEAHEDIQIAYIDRGEAEIQTTTFPKSAKKYAIKFQKKKRENGATIIRGIEE